jgi:hypothetical protein
MSDTTTPQGEPISLPELPESAQCGDQTTDFRGNSLNYTDEEMQDYARAAIIQDRARSAASPDVASEREQFEAYIRKDCGDLSTFGRGENMHYCNSAVNNAWCGWQARGRLAAATQARLDIPMSCRDSHEASLKYVEGWKACEAATQARAAVGAEQSRGEREAFETWMSGKGYGETPRMCSPGSPLEGEYADTHWRDSWEVWQAALSAQTPGEGWMP